ncbi:MAG: ABC transporter ATP-binding protein [Acidobacteria bacterium]|nr:ABC transporter ATP-binding protein [Acidobacteriota bacterium]MXZ39042.1 ABC transporter ATP-binding protein [Holophagales bacterium]MYF04866.1 ABC transporter ATP-binding protein [Holophagales bacterium]MYJ25862.1 ABC transporter ATP-binding protein [Holophagales bacterium]
MELVGFFLRYVRRYLHWGLLALAGIVVFGVATLAFIGLIHPMFEEVLLATEDEIQDVRVGGLAGGGEESDSPLARLFQPVEAFTAGLRASAADLYDDLKERAGIEGRSEVFFAPALIVLVILLRCLMAFVSGYSFQRAGLGITTDIRNDLYRHIIHQSSRFHQRYTSGELYSRVVSDVSKLQNAVAARLFDIFMSIAMLLFYGATLLTIHFTLAVVSLFAVPLFAFLLARFGKGMRKVTYRSQERMADLSGLLTEGIRGNRVVKAFGMEEFECGRFERATRGHLLANLRAQFLSTLSSPVIESTAAVGGAALVISAGLMIRDGRLTFADFFQFLLVLLMMYDPIRKLNKVNLVLQEAVACSHRIHGLMQIESDIVDHPTAAPVSVLERSIRFDDVSFDYEDTGHGKAVLSGIRLDLHRGEVLALVGASGAGKSTLVNLLPRFFDPVSGRVLIDDVDIRALPLQNLRSLIGIVTQETVLFNDSVRNNIAYGRDDLPLEEVRMAAAAAYADDFIMAMPEGYDTVIGEGGQNLSGGQRQRLAIARALLKNAPILILDEATSHLDTESEVVVQRAIYNLMEGRTALVIAHRLSTVVRADRIVVLDRGSIVEEGTHEQLLELGGAYKRLYDLQFHG